eukprot:135038-Amphidinium_carterae.1
MNWHIKAPKSFYHVCKFTSYPAISMWKEYMDHTHGTTMNKLMDYIDAQHLILFPEDGGEPQDNTLEYEAATVWVADENKRKLYQATPKDEPKNQNAAGSA